MVGRTVRVLFEKHGRQIDQVVGKSDYLHAVHASGDDDKIGCVENVLITKKATPILSRGKLSDFFCWYFINLWLVILSFLPNSNCVHNFN